MRKKIFFGFIFLFLNTSLFSQNQILIGFDLKPQITSLVGENNFMGYETNNREVDTKIGMSLRLDYFLKEKISIGSGICYNPQGIKREDLTVEIWGDRFFIADIDYLRIPINITYYIKRNDNLNIKISSGVGFNYLLQVTDNLGNIVNFINSPITEPKDRYIKLVFDAVASVGIDYKLINKLYLTTDIEGMVGLNKFHESYISGIDIDSKTISAGLIVGIKYEL